MSNSHGLSSPGHGGIVVCCGSFLSWRLHPVPVNVMDRLASASGYRTSWSYDVHSDGRRKEEERVCTRAPWLLGPDSAGDAERDASALAESVAGARLRHGRLDLGAAVIDARRAICRSHYRLFISLSLRNEGHNIFQTLWPFCIRTVTRTQSSMAPVRTADKDQPVAGASSGGEQKQRRKPGRVPVSCAECRRYVGLQTCICPGGE